MQRNDNQAVSQQSAIELPKFEEVIKIEVEVQDVYLKLLNEFPADYKHKELVSHAIIGSAVNTNSLGHVYNAMNGYSPMIDFKVGDYIMCEMEARNVRYDSIMENGKGERLIPVGTPTDHKPMWKNRMEAIGKCKVVEINLYSSEKLKVEFEEDDRYESNKKETSTRWVNHKSCTKWAELPA